MNYKVISICDNMYTICDECKMSCINQIRHLTKDNDYIIVDIGKVRSINSTVLSSIIEFKDKVILCNPTPISVNIFSILGVDKCIKVFYSVEDAIKYIEEGSSTQIPNVSHRI